MLQTNTTKHIRFAVLAADTALFTLSESKLLVRLIKIHRPPFFVDDAGLPGGLLNPKENAEEAASRHVGEKSDIKNQALYFEQLHTFSEVNRDPRGRVVAVAHLALIPWEKLSLKEKQNSKEAWWSEIKNAKGLAYDHDDVLSLALKRLQFQIKFTTVISKLMPKEFTLSDLETAYEEILKTDLDKRNFRKKILKLNIVKQVKGKRTGGKFRPAQLYSFSLTQVKEIGMV